MSLCVTNSRVHFNFFYLLVDIITTRQRVHAVGGINPEKISICGQRWQLITLNVLIMRMRDEMGLGCLRALMCNEPGKNSMLTV